jgi:hypothetical protein
MLPMYQVKEKERCSFILSDGALFLFLLIFTDSAKASQKDNL